jgi:hypothetical protein
MKAQQAAIAKNKGKMPPGMVLIEEYKEPEPTWEQDPLTELDMLFDDDNLDTAYYCTTSTLPSGLIVKHFSTGEICQTT